MEPTTNKKEKLVKKSAAGSLRVKLEVKKAVIAELAKVNKKTYGRKVRVDQLLVLLLNLLKPEHILKLQEQSLSNSDRIEMKYREYIKQNGAITKDEFLGLLITLEGNKTEVKKSHVAEEKGDSNAD